jgi:hypothetical protein
MPRAVIGRIKFKRFPMATRSLIRITDGPCQLTHGIPASQITWRDCECLFQSVEGIGKMPCLCLHQTQIHAGIKSVRVSRNSPDIRTNCRCCFTQIVEQVSIAIEILRMRRNNRQRLFQHGTSILELTQCLADQRMKMKSIRVNTRNRELHHKRICSGRISGLKESMRLLELCNIVLGEVHRSNSLRLGRSFDMTIKEAEDGLPQMHAYLWPAHSVGLAGIDHGFKRLGTALHLGHQRG